jgi:hypothetical protein
MSHRDLAKEVSTKVAVNLITAAVISLLVVLARVASRLMGLEW